MSNRETGRPTTSRPLGFYIEDEDLYYVELGMVGMYMSYETLPARKWPWSKKPETKKPTFGFARVLDN